MRGKLTNRNLGFLEPGFPAGQIPVGSARKRWLMSKYTLVPILLLLTTACGGDEIYHDLTESQAIQMQVLLETAGIGSDKIRDTSGRKPTYTIQVDSRDAAKARRLVLDRDLPRVDSQGMAETFSADPGLIPTATQERARLIAALSGEVEEKLKLLPGIVDAHVTVVMPEDDPLRDVDKTPDQATASVVYRYQTPIGAKAEEVGPPIGEGDTRALVAAAVPGLKPNDVVVIARLAASDLLPEPGHEGEVSVLGVRIHSSSKGRFLAIVIGLLGAALLAILGLAWLIFGRRHHAEPGEV